MYFSAEAFSHFEGLKKSLHFEGQENYQNLSSSDFYNFYTVHFKKQNEASGSLFLLAFPHDNFSSVHILHSQ